MLVERSPLRLAGQIHNLVRYGRECAAAARQVASDELDAIALDDASPLIGRRDVAPVPTAELREQYLAAVGGGLARTDVAGLEYDTPMDDAARRIWLLRGLEPFEGTFTDSVLGNGQAGAAAVRLREGLAVDHPVAMNIYTTARDAAAQNIPLPTGALAAEVLAMAGTSAAHRLRGAVSAVHRGASRH